MTDCCKEFVGLVSIMYEIALPIWATRKTKLKI